MTDPRNVIFVDRTDPILEAGDYAITITQTIAATPTAPAPSNAISDAFTNTRTFTVRGERFALDPGEVVAVFPPENNTGEYFNVLPHVVFERKTLPWERASDRATAATWLALLLFEADEAPRLQQARVGDLQRDPFFSDATRAVKQPSTLKDATTVSYGDADPSFTLDKLESGEHAWDSCQVIDVPVPLFLQIAPSVADLAFLAHVRRAPGDRSCDSNGSTADRAVVVGNRLPQKDSSCVVHLVSLEGLAAYLPAFANNDPGKYVLPSIRMANAATDAKAIRLISLKSWSFTSKDGPGTFSGYLGSVDIKPPTLQRKTIAVPGADSGAQSTVAAAFALGYTAIDHHTRLGDQTVSWYRGPLLPYETSPTIVPPPGTGDDSGPVITASDQAVRYDPENGLMDVSYAVAWETGRLLALASKAFSISLYNWKRAAAQKTAVTLQGARVGGWLSRLGHGGGSPVKTAARLAGKIAGRP